MQKHTLMFTRIHLQKESLDGGVYYGESHAHNTRLYPRTTQNEPTNGGEDGVED